MAFITDRTLFIHVQKTGGMSVRRVLFRIPGARESGDAEAERHWGLPELRATHPGIEAGRLSFGFVRHPVEWIVSRWSFAVQTGYGTQAKHRGSAAALWLGACWADDFETFCERYLERYPGIATQTMFRMLGLWSDKPADRVGKTETLLSDLETFLHDAGEAMPALENTRQNETRRDRVPVPSRLRSRIMEAERPLCERFNYA